MSRLLISTFAAALVTLSSLAAAAPATARAEVNRLSLYYTGQPCRSDYYAKNVPAARRLDAAGLRQKRTQLYTQTAQQLAQEARQVGYHYRVGYEGNHIWASIWSGQQGRSFKVLSLYPAYNRHLSCQN